MSSRISKEATDVWARSVRVRALHQASTDRWRVCDLYLSSPSPPNTGALWRPQSGSSAILPQCTCVPLLLVALTVSYFFSLSLSLKGGFLLPPVCLWERRRGEEEEEEVAAVVRDKGQKWTTTLYSGDAGVCPLEQSRSAPADERGITARSINKKIFWPCRRPRNLGSIP